MAANDVIEVLDRLDGAGIGAWLDGGWGVDALLGEQTRAHDDLDLIVRVVDAEPLIAELGRDGFAIVEGRPTSNLVLGDSSGRAVDIHTVTFDEYGNGIYRMLNGEVWEYPAAGFPGTGMVAGRDVRCLTPETQMLCHSIGYDPNDRDFHDMRLLNERFATPLVPPFDRPGSQGT
jgi:lincosamide nucleotidyltransferase A/C/D/E